MNMKEKNQLYKDHEKMVAKQSHFFANKYSIEFDEVHGKALEIFCTALLSHDAEKGKFSTHLFHELNRLNYYCKILVSQRSSVVNIDDVLIAMKCREEGRVLLQDSIAKALSPQAQSVVTNLLDTHDKRVASQTGIREFLKTGWSTASLIQQEIRTWWRGFEEGGVLN